MGEIRGNTRKGISGCYEDTGRVGRGRKASIRITRRKRCKRKEEKRTECKEKHDMMVMRMCTCTGHTVTIPSRNTYTTSERAAGRIPVLEMTTSASTLPSSDQRRPAKETVDVSILREIARNSLVHALNSVSPFPFPFCVVLSFTISKVNGAKTLVLDPSLAGPLSLVTEVSLLQVISAALTSFDGAYNGHSNMASIRCSGSNPVPSPQSRRISCISVAHG